MRKLLDELTTMGSAFLVAITIFAALYGLVMALAHLLRWMWSL